MIEIINKKEDIEKFLNVLRNRNSVDQGEYIQRVSEIVGDVKKNRDKALLKYTKMYDNSKATIDNIEISYEELELAYESLTDDMKHILNLSKERIENYHKHQKLSTWTKDFSKGEIMGQKITPLASVGVYVPGGKAAYASSVIMNVMPAKVAGVEKIIMVTPAPNGVVSKTVLAAAYLCGVDRIFKIGGAQAIAALAYGTDLIPAVDKIVGPGNIYVALAKKMVFGQVGIDSIAGPSEILIIADDKAYPKFVASDLLGQAEHDELASGILVTNSQNLAKSVKIEVNKYYETALRKVILAKSLVNYSKIIVLDNLDDCFNLSNIIAPEHLELAIDKPFDELDKVKNAGAIFLGHYTPEALGDYMAGPNHVLPTGQTARFFSPLSVDDFIKKSSIISFSKEALNKVSREAIAFALDEGLQMHAESIKIRK